jgi:O-antigen ligase
MLGALVLLPWFWGGVELWAYRGAAAAIVLAAAIQVVRGGVGILFPGEDRRIWLPAVVLGFFGMVQAVPLPRAVVAVLSPKSASIQAAAFGTEKRDAAAWLRALEDRARSAVPEAPGARSAGTAARPGGGAPPAPVRWTISLLPSETAERAFWYVALLAAFAFVSARAARREVSAVYRTAILTNLGLIALIALAQRSTAPATLLWMRPAPEMSRPFGPYVNPDHFAGAMELGIPWMLGLAALRLRSKGGRGPVDAALLLTIAGAALGFVAAVLAASKTATGLILLSLMAMSFGAVRGKRTNRIRLVVAGAVTIVVLGAVLAGPLGERLGDFLRATGGRFGETDRWLAWRSAVPMARDYWLTGSGLGAFRVAFPAYLPAGDWGIWAQAHSDWLELVLGGGAIALALTIAILVAYARSALGALRREAALGRQGPVLGALLGVASLAIHAFFDFNHQNPANALMFVATAAWAVSPLRSQGGAR